MDENGPVPVAQQMLDYNEEIKAEKNFKPCLFTYPDFKTSSTVFYEEDMDDLMVLCIRSKTEQKDTVYVWKMHDFIATEISEQDFISKSIQTWSSVVSDKREYQLIQEIPGEESEDF